MSYYPHNQPITTVAAKTGVDDRDLQAATASVVIPTATMAEQSQAGSPTFDEEPLPPLPTHLEHPPARSPTSP